MGSNCHRDMGEMEPKTGLIARIRGCLREGCWWLSYQRYQEGQLEVGWSPPAAWNFMRGQFWEDLRWGNRKTKEKRIWGKRRGGLG